MAGARMILHSSAYINGKIVEIMTLELIFHRFLQAQVNTHGDVAKNSGSSRAVPVRRMLESVITNPAYPVEWRKEKKGMQGGDLVDTETALKAETIWDELIEFTTGKVRELQALGIHKQTANRPLEPYAWQTIVATATRRGWDHVLKLRDSDLAQPEIRDLAKVIKYTVDRSEHSQVLGRGDWHLPFVDGVDYRDIIEQLGEEDARRISAARCARVSYLTHDGKVDWNEDLRLARQLAFPEDGNIHASPFEHVCTPANDEVRTRLWPFATYRQEVERGNF